MLGAIIVVSVTLPSTAQPTGAGARVLSSVPKALVRTFLGPFKSVLVGQSSSLPDSRCPPLHPLPRAGPVHQVSKEVQGEWSRFSENLRRAGTEGRTGRCKSTAMPTCFGIRKACFTGNVGVGSIGVVFSSTYSMCQAQAQFLIPMTSPTLHNNPPRYVLLSSFSR